MINYIINIASILLISLVVFTIIKKNKKSSDSNIDLDYMEIVKVLQEIACDYRVRVVKSGWGEGIDPYIENQCLSDMEIEHLYMLAEKYIDNDSDEYYFIGFKVFGKYYLTYAKNEMLAWANVVRKARERSRDLFGRTGSLDKYKIQ